MGKPFWTEDEQVMIIGHVVLSDILTNTKRKTKARAIEVKNLAQKLLNHPIFTARLKADNPENTMMQHIRAWIRHLEDGAPKPPLKKTKHPKK